MRFATYFVLATVLLSPAAFAEDVPVPAPKGKVELKTQKEKASYAIGLDIGRNIKRTGVDVSPELVAKGIADMIAGAKPLLSDEELAAVMAALQKEMQAKAEANRAKFLAERKTLAEKNIKDGKAFLDANKSKPGVKTLASGLQYKVLKSGTGKTPKASDAVKANYKGTLIDGTQFDASTEPATFRVRGVIPGWTEALQLMKVGDKWQVFIPAELAYGEEGTPDGAIGPSAVLIFEMELVGIVE